MDGTPIIQPTYENLLFFSIIITNLYFIFGVLFGYYVGVSK